MHQPHLSRGEDRGAHKSHHRSTAFGQQKEGSTTIPRNKYIEIRADRPSTKEDAKRPEFKVCKFTTEAIITEGSDKREFRRVCRNPACPIHHPQEQTSRDDGKWKAEQEKHRREEDIANATGLRVLAVISAAVSVRLMKRDLLFVAEQLALLLDQNRLTVLARQHGIKKAKDNDSIEKLFIAYLRRTDESAPWAVCWSKEASCYQLPATIPRRFFAMRRRPTRWTLTPSPSRSSKSSRPKKR
jgi:ParB family transcriptional regulator, chromosome partitioning protein